MDPFGSNDRVPVATEGLKGLREEEGERAKGAPIAEDIQFSTPLTPSTLAQSNQQRMGNFLRGRNKAGHSRDIEPGGKMHADKEPIIVIAIYQSREKRFIVAGPPETRRGLLNTSLEKRCTTLSLNFSRFDDTYLVISSESLGETNNKNRSRNSRNIDFTLLRLQVFGIFHFSYFELIKI